MRKFLAQSPSFVFYPAALIWSLLFGIAAGAFFKILAVYENWRAINEYHFILWKKYPQRSYRHYISAIWLQQIRGLPMEFAEYTKQRVEQVYPVEPYPFGRLFVNTCFMVLILPYMILVGMIKGPVYVYRRAVAARNNSIQTSPKNL